MDEKERKVLDEQLGELGTNLDDYRKRVDKLEEEGKSTSELREAIDKIGADMVEGFVSKQSFEALAAKNDQIEKRFEDLKFAQKDAGIEPDEHRKATLEMLRTNCFNSNALFGTPAPSAVEFFRSESYMNYLKENRTLTEGTDTAGGLFVDPVLETAILKNIVDIDPVRTIAQVTTIALSDRQKGWRRTGTPSASWETETGSGSDSQSSWAPYEIPVHALVGKTPISGDLLADVTFVENELISDMGEQFNFTEGVAFVEGTGAGKPMGFTTNVGTDDAIFPATVTSTGTAASNAIQADDIPKMWGTLKAPYRGNSTWGFNSNSFISLLSLKDGNNRYYLTADGGLAAGPVNLMYGRPFLILETLPDEGSDTYPLWFGDFRAGYRIVDRSGIQMLNDPFTIWPKVYFKMRKRVGGQVIKAEAIKGLKVS